MATTANIRPGLKEIQDEYNTMNYEVREDNEGNVFVKDLSLVPVTTMVRIDLYVHTFVIVLAHSVSVFYSCTIIPHCYFS
jgi:hypothetical protein